MSKTLMHAYTAGGFGPVPCQHLHTMATLKFESKLAIVLAKMNPVMIGAALFSLLRGVS